MSTPIDISERNGVRYLHFGSEWIQGAMRIRRPDALELAYTQEMMAGLLLREPSHWPHKVLTIGVGAGSICKFVLRHLPKTRLTAVEIDPRVVTAAAQFFELPAENERFRVVIADGVHFMLDDDKRYDWILVDGFDRHARAGALDSEPFYQACRCRLSDRGLLATNLFGRSRGYAASIERLTRAFDGRALAFPSCDEGNVVALGAYGEALAVPVAELRARALELRESTGLDLRATVSRLERAGRLPGGALEL